MMPVLPSQRKKLGEMAEKKRSGIKSRRGDPKRRKNSSDSETEIVESDTDAASTPKPSTSQGPMSSVKSHLSKVMKKELVRESSEDSDFEPRSSQRFKPCLMSNKKRRSKDAPKTTSENSTDEPSLNKIKKEASSSKNPEWVLLDSHAEDVACVANVLNEQVSKFRQRFLEQSWEQNMLPIAMKDLHRYVKRAVSSLSDIGESIDSLNTTFRSSSSNKTDCRTGLNADDDEGNCNPQLNNSTILLDDSDEEDTPLCKRVSNGKKRDQSVNLNQAESGKSPKLQRCGSTSSDSSDIANGENGNEEYDVSHGLNNSEDLFADDNCTDTGSLCPKLNTDPDSADKSSKVQATEVTQTRKSLACKSELLACSSSDSEAGASVPKPKTDSESDRQDYQTRESLACKSELLACSSSDSEAGISVQKSKADSESDGQDSHSLKFKRSTKADIKINFEAYQSDEKLQGNWSVDITKLEPVKEKEYLDKVGNYYKPSSPCDSDNSSSSIDYLTNLAGLNWKAKGKVTKNSNDEETSDGADKKRNKGGKSKEKEKLADFLNKTNAELSDDDQSFETLPTSITEPQTVSINERQKNLLLQSSDSEGHQSDVESDHDDADKDSPKKKKKLKTDSIKTEGGESDEAAGGTRIESEPRASGDSEAEETSKDSTDIKKKKSWRSAKLLCAKLSDTDTSDDEKKRLKKKQKSKEEEEQSSDELETSIQNRKKLGTPRKSDADVIAVSDESSASSDDFVKKKKRKVAKKSSSSSEPESPKPKKKRKRIKVTHSSSDSEEEKGNKTEESPTKGRKKLRHIIGEDELEKDTKAAGKEEEERLKRIERRQKMYDEVYENIQKGFDVIDKLVLDFDEVTKEPLVEVDSSLVKKLKPHQAKGVKFMWDACFESLKMIEKTKKGSGCILAHCMGLGKTFQIVTLVHTLFRFPETKVKTVLVVCPVSTVLNWVNEFEKWLRDVEDGPNIEVHDLIRCKQVSERSWRLKEWQEDGGVMIIGYDMFRNLTNPGAKRYKVSIMKTFQSTLVDPGPDLVICDEGHLLKNEETGISKAMTRIRTLRRIILTGTPLQNNLKEYHCMVQFIKPNLLGTRKEFLNRFVNPITNGQFEDSTAHDVKRMKRRAHVLHKTLEGCVQRYDYSVLTPFLPAKEEYVISLRLTEVQEKMYAHYLEHYSSRGYQGKGAQLFADFQQLARIWTHPRVLKMSAERAELKAEKEEEDSEGSLRDFIDDGDESDTSSASSSSSQGSDNNDVVCLSDDSHKGAKKSKKVPTRRTRANKDVPEEPEPPPPQKQTEWWESFVQESDFEDLRGSAKLVLLFSILKDCEENGEKLLVFSQSLFSLDIIEYFLGKIDEATQRGIEDELLDGHQGSWSPGIDYFRLDGSTPTDLRNTWCNLFNKPTNLKGRLFLISTKAGGLGINLVAANRVVIFDASWNPSHDVQSIFRVYRFGQKKPCFIYRFLAQGTMEEKIYERQVTKLSLACRVVDEQQIERYYKMADLQELYTFTPADRTIQAVFKLPKDHLLAEILKKHETLITKYHEHDSLLENKEEEELNEDERQAAWEEYEKDKKGPVNQGGLLNGLDQIPSLEQFEEVLRVRHPEMSDDDVKLAAANAYKQSWDQQQLEMRRRQLEFQQQYQQQLMFQQQQQEQMRLQQMAQAMAMAMQPRIHPQAQQPVYRQQPVYPLQQNPRMISLGAQGIRTPSTSAGPSHQQGNAGTQQPRLPNPYNRGFPRP